MVSTAHVSNSDTWMWMPPFCWSPPGVTSATAYDTVHVSNPCPTSLFPYTGPDDKLQHWEEWASHCFLPATESSLPPWSVPSSLERVIFRTQSSISSCRKNKPEVAKGQLSQMCFVCAPTPQNYLKILNPSPTIESWDI